MRRISPERAILLALLIGAALACALGLWKPVTTTTQTTTKQQIQDIGRLVLTVCLAITMVMGPGITVRALLGRPIRLAFLPLFGIGLLVLTGCAAWCLHGVLATKTTSIAVIAPTLGLMFGILLAAGDDEFLSPEERRTLLLVGIPIGLAIARSFLYYGPIGELNAGEISRNLVTEPRPDSHTSFVVAAMVAHGTHPYGSEGAGLFAPYMFSSRGPVAGIASAPLMLVTGGRPILGVPNQVWEPFDPEGFMAYRVAMIVMSGTALISLWQLVRQIAGKRAARLAVVLGMSTPFVYSELIFTWPKLLAASMILLSAIWLFERKPVRAGMAIGVGYLFHPSALFGYLALGLLALWPFKGAKLWRPQVKTLVLMAIGTAIFVVAWQIANHGHNGQEGFLDYFEEAGANYHPSLAQWISFRATSLADTVVPFYLPIFQSHNPSINVFFGISPGVAHWFFQYWTSITFAYGILFFPVLLVGFWRFAKRRPWPFFAVIVFPFVFFWIYWGNGSSGFPREGIQAWILAVLAVLAVEQAAEHFSWMRSRTIRAILVLRGFEVFADALGATFGTRGIALISAPYPITDVFAAVGIVLFTVLMMFAIWWETRPGSLLRPAVEEGPVPDSAAPLPKSLPAALS
jgi:Dolichyl-phosphate-mannose-protein mannosyltransferase